MADGDALRARQPRPGRRLGRGAARPRLLATYRQLFGPDRWCLNAGSWRLLGINAQLLGTGSPEEAEQWQWLEARTSGRPTPMSTILFLIARWHACAPGTRRTAADTSLGRPGNNFSRAAPLDASCSSRVTAPGSRRHRRRRATSRTPSSGFVIPDGCRRGSAKGSRRRPAGAEGRTLASTFWGPDGILRHDLSLIPALHALEARHDRRSVMPIRAAA